MQIDAYSECMRDDALMTEYACWLNGYYVLEALGCAFGKRKYPKNPIEEAKDKRTEKEKKVDENKKQEQMFVAQMLIRQANFNLSKMMKESDDIEETT